MRSFITLHKERFSIKDFFSKCDQIRRKMRIWSYLLKKSLREKSIFCAVLTTNYKDITLTPVAAKIYDAMLLNYI